MSTPAPSNLGGPSLKRIDALVKDWRAQADFIESCKLGAEETGIVKAMRMCADEIETTRRTKMKSASIGGGENPHK